MSGGDGQAPDEGRPDVHVETAWNDPIVEEVRRVREEYAARFGFDLEEMVEDLRQLEASGEFEMVEDPGLSDAWLQEIRRRRERIASGEVEPLDEDEMFARIEARRR